MVFHALRTVLNVDLSRRTDAPTERDLLRRWLKRGFLYAAACTLAAPSPAAAKDAIPLAQLVTDLGRSTRTEILFDEALLRGLSGRRPARGTSVEVALRQLLAGTGVEFVRLPGGGYTLFRRSAGKDETSAEPAVAEILVIGRRLLNVDLPRSPNGVQPYRIVTRDEVQSAHRDNLDQFFRARVSANADLVAPAQNVIQDPGEARSSIDLRGIGANRTLVLVDGRRLPRLPYGMTNMLQSDLNGIPPGAIERVEILTSTAGGIYGSDATGGVVNVVLRRDYRGSELTVTSGIADRGDAGRIRIEGRTGWTSSDGATQAMLYGSYATSQPFLVSQRDYSIRARERAYANDPVSYPSLNSLSSQPPGNAILLINILNSSLAFDAEHGGGSLGARFTYLPLDFRGTEEERTALLLRNAGKIDLSLPAGSSGKGRTLMNNPRILSGIFSARHEFGESGAELFVDGLYTQSMSNSINQNYSDNGSIAVTAPDNPFAQSLIVRFPLDLPVITELRRKTYRLTAGAILPLGGTWRASGDVTFSRLHQAGSVSSPVLDASFYNALALGSQAAAGERPVLRPLADWAGFLAALPSYAVTRDVSVIQTNSTESAALRAGGSVIDLPGGPLWLNLLAERRQEKVPTARVTSDGILLPRSANSRKLKFYSAYFEARAPLTSLDGGFAPLRGLELQIAGRFDRLDASVPNDLPFAEKPLTSLQRDAAIYTVGARVQPRPWLMLRTSYATGEVTPDAAQIQSLSRPSSRLPMLYRDPKRGGRLLGSEAPYVLRYGGSEDIRQERASTLTAGAVINPTGRGPRFSVDYSRIIARRRIEPFRYGRDVLALMEAEFPERVIRAPLSDADRSLGFTGGPVIEVDERAANSGRSILHTVEFDFEWRIANVAGGELTPYATATWLPSFRVQLYPGTPWIERAGYRDGPVEWRGNGGLRWEKGRLNLDLNAQYVGSYRARYNGPGFESRNSYLTFQGADRFPAQVYLDLALGWTLVPRGTAVREANFRFGIQNLLDHSPPIVADLNGINYSPYGDPRRRRFELSIALRR